MKKSFSLFVAIALALSLNAEAQTATAPPPSTGHATLMGALKGGGIGCLAGGLLGAITHHSALKSCAVGAATGAVIGGVRAHRQQLKQARALQEQAEAAGATANLQTQTVTAKDDNGQSQKTDALQHLTLNLPADEVDAHADGMATVIAKAARLADASSDPVTLTVSGTSSQRAWIVSTLRGDLKADTTARIDEQSGSAPSLDITPVPDLAK